MPSERSSRAARRIADVYEAITENMILERLADLIYRAADLPALEAHVAEMEKSLARIVRVCNSRDETLDSIEEWSHAKTDMIEKLTAERDALAARLDAVISACEVKAAIQEAEGRISCANVLRLARGEDRDADR